MVEKSKEIDWIDYELNPHIKFQLDTEKFRCVTCNQELKGKAAAARHSSAIHKTALDGEKIKQKKKTIVDDSRQEDEEVTHSEFEDDSKFSDIEQIVYANLNQEYARGGTQIAQNTDLRFIYEKTKRMFPPEWNFEIWITGLVTFALKQFGINVSVWQDKKSLSLEKLQFIEQVQRDWNEKLNEFQVNGI